MSLVVMWHNIKT